MIRVKIQDGRLDEGYRLVNLNRRKAIMEKCFNCSGYSFRDRKNCPANDCELWPYRLGLGSIDSKKRGSAIRHYCKDYCSEGGDYHVRLCPSVACALFPYRMTTIDRSIEIP